MTTLDPEFISRLYPGSLKVLVSRPVSQWPRSLSRRESLLNDGQQPVATTPTGEANVLKVTASQKDIDEVSSLAGYKNLARLDVGKNNIEDLQGLKSNKELTWLSVANNSLSTLQAVAPLTKLQVLNAGGNAISGEVDLAPLTNLKALILNHNRITRVSGLAEMPELNTVVLSHNRLQKLAKTVQRCTALSKLSVTHNQISDLGPALKDCTRLFELKVGHNNLEDLPPSLSKCHRLRILDLAGNKISSTAGISVLQELPFLRHLTLRGNPLCDQEGYRFTVVEMLPNLESLDGVKIEGRHRGRHKDAKTVQQGANTDSKPEGKTDKAAAKAKTAKAMRKEDDSEDDEVLDAKSLGLSERARGSLGAQGEDAPFLDEVIANDKQRASGSKSVGNTGVVDVVQKKRKKRKNDAGGELATGKKALDLLLTDNASSLAADQVGLGGGGAGAWGAPISEWGQESGDRHEAKPGATARRKGQSLKKQKTSTRAIKDGSGKTISTELQSGSAGEVGLAKKKEKKKTRQGQ